MAGPTLKIAILAQATAAQKEFADTASAARKSGTEVEKAFAGTGADADREFAKVGTAAKQEFGGIGDTARKAFNEVADSAKSGFSKVTDFAKETGKSILTGLGIGAGLDLGGRLSDAITSGLERVDVKAKLVAQLGAAGDRAADLGKIAGKVYADNFGDSFDQVGEAVKRVQQDIGDLGEGAQGGLQGLSEKALSTASIFDQDLGGVTRAVGQLLRTGLVSDANQAFDVITRGFQLGADKAGDLLDTFNEYGTQFHKLGIDAGQATGILVQGLQAGARDADLVADAIKEFSIRAVDGSKTTADGFARLGLSGKQMGEDIGAGGQRANDALDITLDRLRGIKDPVERAQIAVELFGTQAEDLGQALFAIDPSSATQGLGDFAGATKRASDAVADTPLQKIEALKRSLTQWSTEGLGTAIGRVQDLVKAIPSSVLDDIKSSAENLKSALGDLAGAWTELAKAATDSDTGQEALLKGLQLVRGAIDLAVVGVDALIASYYGAAGAAYGLLAAGKLLIGDLDGAKEAWGKAEEAARSHSEAVIKGSQDVRKLGQDWQDGSAKIQKANQDAAAAAVVAAKETGDAHDRVATDVAGQYGAMGSAIKTVAGGISADHKAAASAVSGAHSGAATSASGSFGQIASAGSSSAATASKAHAAAAKEASASWAGSKTAIAAAFSGAGGLLVGAGYSILQGLYNGLVSAWNNLVKPFLNYVSSAIPQNKGPASKDRLLLRGSGQLVMAGFKAGLEDEYGGVQKSLADFTKSLSGASSSTAGVPRIDLAARPDAATTQPATVVLELKSSGSAADQLLLEWFRKSVRARGGNVQLAVMGRA